MSNVTKAQIALPKGWHLTGPHKFTWLRANHRVTHPTGYTLTDPEGYERAYFGALSEILAELSTALANHGETLIVLPSFGVTLSPEVRAQLAAIEAQHAATKNLENHAEKLVVLPSRIDACELSPEDKARLAEMEAYRERTKDLNVGNYSADELGRKPIFTLTTVG